MSQLVWNPAIDKIREIVSDGSRITGCVSAFTTAEAIELLADYFCPERAYLITRWRVAELASGVSDINVYPLLKELGVPMYISYSLHSKLYRFGDGSVLCGSCNATSSGLGLSAHANIETACLVPYLNLKDEISFRELANSSLRVTDEIYEEFAGQVEVFSTLPSDNDCTLEIYEFHKGSDYFFISDLPATKHPKHLIEALVKTRQIDELDDNHIADCVNLQISACNRSEEELWSLLNANFRKSRFVQAIVSLIRSRGSMRFGDLTSFIQTQCRDVPTPYRSEYKERVNTLYNWLEYFFDDLSWDVPGSRSQVIRSTR